MTTYGMNNDNSFFLESVNPNMSLAGKIIFDVPQSVAEGDAQLQVSEGMWGTNTGLINLQ